MIFFSSLPSPPSGAKRSSTIRSIISLLLISIISTAGISCSGTSGLTRTIYPPSHIAKALGSTSPYTKAHMQSGNIYVLENAYVDTAGRSLMGTGALLGINRDTIDQGTFAIGIDSILVVETNELTPSGSASTLFTLTVITAGVALYCAFNPKACFGSCPTFYISDGDRLQLRAEGYSASVAPSLEAIDVDALYHVVEGDREFTIEMRNEALETHVTRHVDLLALPIGPGERVLHDVNDEFHRVTRLRSPLRCDAQTGECLDLIGEFDDREWFSSADSNDLATREEIDLTFEVTPGESTGLVIGARQTLLSTYLFYQTLAWMGSEVGAWLARLERKEATLSGVGLAGEESSLFNTPAGRLMGGIEVLVKNVDGEWEAVAEVREPGPLATDVHLVPLPPHHSTRAEVRIRLARGNWRLDYLALAGLGERISPIRLHPSSVEMNGRPDAESLAQLLDTARHLMTLPGDVCRLTYELPDGTFELLLESRGYYLEWMRQEWIGEENPVRLAMMLFTPEVALRTLAPEFKKVEAEMDQIFWSSRFGNHSTQ